MLVDATSFLVWNIPYRWWMLAVIQITHLCVFPLFGILLIAMDHETASLAVRQTCLWSELLMLGCMGTSLWVIALIKPPPSVETFGGEMLPVYEESKSQEMMEAKQAREPILNARTV